MAFDSEEDFQAILDTEEFDEAMEDSGTFVARTDSYVVDQIPVVRRERGSGLTMSATEGAP